MQDNKKQVIDLLKSYAAKTRQIEQLIQTCDKVETNIKIC